MDILDHPSEYVICLICNKHVQRISTHVRAHHITKEQYMSMFPGAPLVSDISHMKVSNNTKKQWSDENTRATLVKAIEESDKSFYKSKEFKDKVSESQKKRWKDPVQRARLSETKSRQHEDPELRSKISKSVSKYYKEHPEAGISHSEHMREMFRDDKFRSSFCESQQRRWNNPDNHKKISDSLKKKWKEDKDYATRVTQRYTDRPEDRYILRNYMRDHSIGSRSHFEIEVEEYINSLSISTEHDRHILDGKEIDIYIPDKSIGIECNGIYWHSTMHINDQLYHYNKWFECRSKGIHLIQILDYNWKYNKDKIKAYLRDLLIGHSKIVRARKCYIEQINPSVAKEFYEKYHLQGCNRSYSINYGLYYNECLLSCMSFDKSRIRNKKNPEGCYELHRYCILPEYSITGGADRLFKRFIDDYSPIRIVSYSDNDYFSGQVYEKLGFSNDSVVRVYYRYDYHTLRTREQCQLKYLKQEYPELVQESLELKEQGIISNREDYICDRLNWLTYYTSGRTKWIWERTT